MYLTWIKGLGVSDLVEIVKRQKVVNGKGYHSIQFSRKKSQIKTQWCFLDHQIKLIN